MQKVTFGERLKQIRVESALNQHQMAEALGWSRPALSYYEQGARNPTIDFLLLLHKQTGFSMDYLMGVSDDRSIGAGCDNSISALVDRAYRNAVDHGFWEDPPEFGTSIALMHGELSEALEEARTGHSPDEMYYGKDGKPEGVPSELADTVIRIFDLCGHWGIDLEGAILQKMAYNAKRPRKHGKKF